jgi:predicted ArsR family transcriptional regulator
MSMSQTNNEGDQQLIESLRRAPMTIHQLEDELGVTANAIRQRLVRLMASGLVSREKSSEGLGRPKHRYLLTDAGHRTAGDNFGDLAKALWQEIQSIDDPKIRQSVMSGAVQRLLDSYETQVSGETVDQRIASVSKFFADRNIPIAVEQSNDLPVIKVLECPYPDLEDADHQFCEIEKRLFAKVIGGPVQLCQCRKDGDGCCTFQSVGSGQAVPK